LRVTKEAGFAKLVAKGLAKGLITGFVVVDFNERFGVRGWLGSLDCKSGWVLRAPTAAAANGLEMSGGLGDEVTGEITFGGLCLKGWLRGIAALKLGYFWIFFRISADNGEEGVFNGNG